MRAILRIQQFCYFTDLQAPHLCFVTLLNHYQNQPMSSHLIYPVSASLPPRQPTNISILLKISPIRLRLSSKPSALIDSFCSSTTLVHLSATILRRGDQIAFLVWLSKM